MSYDKDTILDDAVAKCAFVALTGEMPRSGRGYPNKDLWQVVNNSAVVVTPLPEAGLRNDWFVSAVKQSIKNVKQNASVQEVIPDRGGISSALNTLSRLLTVETKAGKLKSEADWTQLPKNLVIALA